MTRWTASQVTEVAPDASSLAAARKLAVPGPVARDRLQRRARVGPVPGQRQDALPGQRRPRRSRLPVLLPEPEVPLQARPRPADAVVRGRDRRVRPDRGLRRRVGHPARRARGHARPRRRRQPPDPAARAKRLEQRLARMDAGVEDFRLWLADLVRGGLAAARTQPYSYWDTAAARLVDAQLPALAERVREAGVAGARPPRVGGVPPRRGRAAGGPSRAPGRRASASTTSSWPRSASPSGGPSRARRSATPTCAPGRGPSSAPSAPTTGGSSSSAPGWPTTTARWSPCSTSPATARPSPSRSSAAPGSTSTSSRYPGAAPRRALFRDPPTGAVPVTALPGRTSLAEVHAAAARRLGRTPWRDLPPGAARRRAGRRATASSGGSATTPARCRWRTGAPVWTLLAVSGGAARGRLRRGRVGRVPPARGVAGRPGGGPVSAARPVAGRRRHRRPGGQRPARAAARSRRPRPRRRRRVRPSTGCSPAPRVADALTRGGAPLPPAERRGPGRRRRGPPAGDRPRHPAAHPAADPVAGLHGGARRAGRGVAPARRGRGPARAVAPAARAARLRCRPAPGRRGPRRRARRARALAGRPQRGVVGPSSTATDEPHGRGRRPTGSRRGRRCRARGGHGVRRSAGGPTPAAARDLLEAQWTTVSAKVRADAVRALGPGLSAADEPLLERALDDRAKSVREAAAAMLDRLPASARAARMADRLRRLVRVRGTLVRHLEVDVPDAPDEAAVRDGLTAPAKGGRPRRPPSGCRRSCAARRSPPGRTSPVAARRPRSRWCATPTCWPGSPRPSSTAATPSGPWRASTTASPIHRLLWLLPEERRARLLTDWVARPLRRVATCAGCWPTRRGRGPTTSVGPC